MSVNVFLVLNYNYRNIYMCIHIYFNLGVIVVSIKKQATVNERVIIIKHEFVKYTIIFISSTVLQFKVRPKACFGTHINISSTWICFLKDSTGKNHVAQFPLSLYLSREREGTMGLQKYLNLKNSFLWFWMTAVYEEAWSFATMTSCHTIHSIFTFFLALMGYGKHTFLTVHHGKSGFIFENILSLLFIIIVYNN